MNSFIITVATIPLNFGKLWQKVKNWDFMSDIMNSDHPICNLIPLCENPNVATELLLKRVKKIGIEKTGFCWGKPMFKGGYKTDQNLLDY